MKKLISIHAALLIVSSVALAQAEDYPDQGTHEWKKMFAVDPADNALAYSPVNFPQNALTYSSVYKGEIAGFDIGRLYLDVTTSDKSYDVKYKMEQKGLARWFSDAEATSKARGTFDGTRINQHYYFNHDYEAEDDQQYVEIFRRPDDRRIHLWTSPTYSFHEPVSETQAVGALDPMAALLALGFLDDNNGNSPCDRVVKTFDGRRLFNLVMKDQGKEKLKRNGKNLYRGYAHKCKLEQVKLAGYRADKRGDVEGDVWVYLVEVPEDFRTKTMSYIPVMIKAKQGIFTAWLEGQNPTITHSDGRSVNLGLR